MSGEWHQLSPTVRTRTYNRAYHLFGRPGFGFASGEVLNLDNGLLCSCLSFVVSLAMLRHLAATCTRFRRAVQTPACWSETWLDVSTVHIPAWRWNLLLDLWQSIQCLEVSAEQASMASTCNVISMLVWSPCETRSIDDWRQRGWKRVFPDTLILFTLSWPFPGLLGFRVRIVDTVNDIIRNEISGDVVLCERGDLAETSMWRVDREIVNPERRALNLKSRVGIDGHVFYLRLAVHWTPYGMTLWTASDHYEGITFADPVFRHMDPAWKYMAFDFFGSGPRYPLTWVRIEPLHSPILAVHQQHCVYAFEANPAFDSSAISLLERLEQTQRLGHARSGLRPRR